MSSRLIVSLGSLAGNFQRLARHAQGAVAAVVKADAYGLGASAIASRLALEGCDEFFVATAGEGVTLRQAIPDARIYVSEGAYTETVADLVAAKLIPVLNSPSQIQAWAPGGQMAAIHVDTGMQRLGFSYADGIDAFFDLPFALCLFISHFARADEPGHDSVTQQLHRAAPLYKALKVKHPQMRLSLCNSAGMLQGLGPEHLGRAGVALYGGNPYHQLDNPMLPVVKLEARVMQVRDVEAGIPVGYGGTFVTRRRSRLATLGVGYADGVPRLLSNSGAEVLLGGDRCQIVGRVSMDLTVVDTTGLDIVEGDWAEVMGPGVSIDEVAAQARTLAYEVLTGINARVPRIYVENTF